MRTAIGLGTRLAFGTRGQRARSIAVLLACAIGVAFLLTVWGVAFEQLGDVDAFQRRQIVYLLAGTMLMVALPVIALLATVARLAAAVRDRRLANLRLLGMTADQTRLVAATEVGIVSVLGSLLGVLVHVACAAVIPAASVASLAVSALTVVATSAAVVGIALAPQRGGSGAAIDRARRAAPARAGWWRLLPLAVGLGLSWFVHHQINDHSGREVSQITVLASLFAGVALIGVGVLLVVPVFTRLVAALVLRLGRGPSALILGRRLADQPASMTRVVSTLMVGLFVVMMARAVLGAFLATGQYIAAADQIERDQTAEITVPPAHVAATRRTIGSIATVDRIEDFPVAAGLWGDVEADGPGSTVLIARCADLTVDRVPLRHCSDRRANEVGEIILPGEVAPSTIDVRATRGFVPRGPAATVSTDFSAPPIDADDFNRAVGALAGTNVIVVSPDLRGVAAVADRTEVLMIPHAGPGTSLYDDLRSVGLQSESEVDIANYEFVQGMQRIVWTIAVAVLTLGLLAFTVAALDRGLARRRELTALRLIGTPPSLLRWVQWLEAVVPTALGSLLALGCGAYAGSTYLQLDERLQFPVAAAVGLSVAAVVVSALLAAITVAGTTARLDAEHIRVT